MPYYPSGPEKQAPDSPPRGRILLRRTLLCISALVFLYGAVRLGMYGADLIASRRTARELREVAETEEGSSAVQEPASASVPADQTAEDVQDASSRAAMSRERATAPADQPKEAPNASSTAVTSQEKAILPEPATASAPAGRSGGSPAVSDTLPSVPYPDGFQLVPRIQKLRKKSEHIIGWITMDDLDEPVARRDNTFFLDHDAMGKRNGNGAIFLDERTDLLTRPYTLLLYGHNMKSGAMFGNLRKYRQFSYFHRHARFRFDTLYEEGEYVLFALAKISLTPGKPGYVNILDFQSDSRNTRQSVLDALLAASMHPNLTEVRAEDQLLLLVTCDGEDDERLVAAARRLREDEN